MLYYVICSFPMPFIASRIAQPQMYVKYDDILPILFIFIINAKKLPHTSPQTLRILTTPVP